MMTQIMQDTFQILQAECAPVAEIQLDIDRTKWLETVSLLNQYDELTYKRKVCLLALYTLLELAMQRHRCCSYEDPDLTRRILDGDYLFSLYIQLAVRFNESDFLRYFAPILKRWQITQASGGQNDEVLTACLHIFLDREFPQDNRYKAI